MAGTNNGLIDPDSGFCFENKSITQLATKNPSIPTISTSLRHPIHSLSPSLPSTATALLINAVTCPRLRQINSLSFDLSFQERRRLHPRPQLGVVISPANTQGSTSDISHHIQICKPWIAFATAHVSHSHKLPPNLLIDSPEFLSLLSISINSAPKRRRQLHLFFSSSLRKPFRLHSHSLLLRNRQKSQRRARFKIGVTDGTSVPLFRLFRIGQGGFHGPDYGIHRLVWFCNNVDGCREV